MKKFLNFSTILFSYVLITVLVISCGGSSGGNDGGNVPQVELSEKCFLENRQNADFLLVVICVDGEVMSEIPKTSNTAELAFLIPSIKSEDGKTSRTWDLSKGPQINISYSKAYTLSLDTTDGPVVIIAGDTDTDNDEYLLHHFAINSSDFINETKDALRPMVLIFSTESGSDIKVAITAKLVVKTQQDFVSMPYVTIPGLDSADYKVPFVLENDLALVAPGGEGAKFDSAIIGVAEKAFDFDGGGKTINLNSEIDAVANDKPAAIIGETNRAVTLQNFTLNVNQPISGTEYVSTIIANASSGGLIQNIKININGSLSLYKPNVYSVAGNQAYVGGVLGKSCADINNVVVKTVDDAVIQASIDDDISTYMHYYVGGLVAVVDCPATSDVVTSNNLVDVTLGSFASDGTTGNTLSDNFHWVGGLISEVRTKVIMQKNLVRLSMSRGNNLSADFFAQGVAGFVQKAEFLQSAANNLVYVDFSNLGEYKYAAGFFYELNNLAAANNIANNMVFIADGFDWQDTTYNGLTGHFGLFVGKVKSAGEVANLTDSFFSSPVDVGDYLSFSAAYIGFFVDVYKEINFKNLIVDFKNTHAMFKIGDQTILTALRAKIDTAKIFTLAEAKTNQVSSLFSDGNTSWEEDSNGYPQLKAPSDLSGSVTKSEIEAAWTKTNADIQAGLPARDTSQQIQLQ